MVLPPPPTVSAVMVLPPPPTVSAGDGAAAAALVGFGPRCAREERQQAAPKEGTDEPLEHLLPRRGTAGESFGHLIEGALLRGVRLAIRPLCLVIVHGCPVASHPIAPSPLCVLTPTSLLWSSSRRDPTSCAKHAPQGS